LSIVDWELEFEGLSVDGCFSRLLGILGPLVERYVPISYDGAPCPWKVRPPRDMTKRRRLLWQQYKQLRLELGRLDVRAVAALNQFNVVNYEYRNFVRNDRICYEKGLVAKLASAPKLFHSYVRRKKVGALSVGPIRQESGLVDDPVLLSEIFARNFSSAFVADVPVSPAQIAPVGVLADDLSFSVDGVYSLLCALDSSSAMGPDEIHPMLLKSCASELAFPLHYIFVNPCLWECCPVFGCSHWWSLSSSQSIGIVVIIIVL
jgi:hypothetical protein